MKTVKPQTRLWIDSDITLGKKNSPVSYCDVDDGYAIAALLRSVEVDVVGISSTLGNTNDIAISTQVATDFIHRFGPNSVVVSRGASAPLGEGSQSVPDGVKAMAAALEEGNMSIIGIGAATNIALLVKHYPQLLSKIDELVLLAGRRSIDQHFISGHHQPKPFRDLNFEADVSAYKVLLDSPLSITLVPYEACNSFWIKQHDLLAMLNTSQVAGYLAKKSEPWLLEWELVFGAAGFNPFDLIAAAYVINAAWFSAEQWDVEIVSGPSDTEKGQDKDYLICSEAVNSGRAVRYCTSISEQSKPLLLDRIKAHDMQHFVLGMSHINIIVDDIAKATAFYQSALGFELARDPQGELMDYQHVTMSSFALDAGLSDGKVDVDVRFLKHPQAGMYLELMHYRYPKGAQQLPVQPKTYDLGGPRHVAMEVSNCNEVFKYLKQQPGVRMINPADDYHPDKLDGFPITFFYWIDPYGVQWEMEEGRQVGLSRSIV
ncbi:nucleoside hydrolase [Agarivorans sp. MS3-6]|uniref:nucleoside hydrolase n=1 Tax=Agarivorans sp. TSD2052 TaxID=2937286 RepID=UPI002010B2F7|nr:nucleoside hydrolase [Agarivorans sp. TSD2052]UPW19737.1 nucleoside hydrolase [Agarivorans sp. TSD2052]